MKHTSHAALALAMLLTAAGPRAVIAHAQAADTSKQAADTNKIDPDAIDALNRMGAYLRTLKAFQVKAAVTTEEVLEDGEKVQFGNTADLIAERPDRLRLNVTSDREQRIYFYDGKSFTLFAPRPSFYATVPAPPTIAELITRLQEKYDIDLPFVDLFRWGTPESNVKEITDATDIGPSDIDGTTCEQYAFRQDGLDWQIWIQAGDFALPRKIVLTTMTDDARPQHTSIYKWNLAPSIDATAYVFTPPADAKKITLAEVTPVRGVTKK